MLLIKMFPAPKIKVGRTIAHWSPDSRTAFSARALPA